MLRGSMLNKIGRIKFCPCHLTDGRIAQSAERELLQFDLCKKGALQTIYVLYEVTHPVRAHAIAASHAA